MDEWRSDPTWRHEERLFIDGEPTQIVRDEGQESMDPEHVGASSPSASSPARAERAVPIAPVEPDEPPAHGPRRESAVGFDDEAWSSMGAEAGYDLHEAYTPSGAGSSAATTTLDGGAGGASVVSRGPTGEPVGGFIPGSRTISSKESSIPDAQVEDDETAGAVFPGAFWPVPQTGLTPGFATPGFGTPGGAVPPGFDPPSSADRDVVYDPDVRAERAGWRLAQPTAAPGRSFGRQVVSLLVVVAVFAGIIFYQHRPKPAAARAKLSWATEWDPKVADLVTFVETERGLKFTYPVAVDFIAPEAFDKAIGTANARRTDEPADDPHAVLLRALGLGPMTSFDVTAAVSTTTTIDLQSGKGSSPVVGLYNPATHRIRVRGSDLTAATKATLVHELTHALQDQHFDLDALYVGATTNTQAAAIHAAIEGDAVAVESAYVDATPAAAPEPTTAPATVAPVPTTAATAAEVAPPDPTADPGAVDQFASPADVAPPDPAASFANSPGSASITFTTTAPAPASAIAMSGDPGADPTSAAAAEGAAGLAGVSVDSPEDNTEVAGQVLDYSLAELYVRFLSRRGGQTQRDAIFTDPPRSESDILFPDRQLLHIPVADVDVPQLDKGDKALKSGGAPHDVGPYLLAQAIVRDRLPALAAYKLAKGWAGDAYVAFRRGDLSCARVAVAGVDAGATADISSALHDWAAQARSGATRTVETVADAVGDTIVITGCTPSTPVARLYYTTADPAEVRLDFFTLLHERSGVLLQKIPGVVEPNLADRRCLADTFTERIVATGIGSTPDDHFAKGAAAGAFAVEACHITFVAASAAGG